MKTVYYLSILACAALLVSCYSEGALEPSERVMTSRYEFPQDDNAWDDIAVQIRDEFGVHLIYADFTSDDFKRSWTGSGWAGTEYFGEPLTGEQADFHIRFMKNHVYAYLTREIVQKVLPTYHILTYNMHSASTFWGMTIKTPKELYFDGMDFWTHCMFYDPAATGETIVTPQTKQQFLECRFKLLQVIMRFSCQRGNITLPAGFADGIDFATAVLTTPGSEEDPNYVMMRALPPTFAEGRILFSNITTLSLRYLTVPDLFINYMHSAMFYTDEVYETMWPKAKYTLLWEKRKLVIDHLKTEYNIDLQAMAEGPAVLF